MENSDQFQTIASGPVGMEISNPKPETPPPTFQSQVQTVNPTSQSDSRSGAHHQSVVTIS